MIKTHKPRGHIWTNASAFQQTQEYRNLKFEECIAPPAKVLVRDLDEDLSESARSTKRRRIETLADDFLNGVPLFISSARPCPQSLNSTIVWNKKSSNEPKFVLPRVDLSDEPSAESKVWEDVESDAEILERLRRRRQPSVQPNPYEAGPNAESGVPIEEVEAEQAQASCGRVRRLKTVKKTSGPSEDALRQAAALRARRFQRANSEVPIVQNSLSLQAQVAQTEMGPRREPSYESHGQYDDHRRTSHWLSRRKSLFSFVGREEHDESIDELQLSRLETPSVAARRPKRSSISSEEPEPEPIPAATETQSDTSGDATQDQPPKQRIFGDKQSLQNASYHTAPEQTEVDLELSAAQDASQSYANLSMSVRQRSLPDSSKRNTGNSAKGGRAKSFGNNTPEQSSTSRVTRSATLNQAQNEGDASFPADPQSRGGAAQSKSKQLAYTTAQPSQNGSTPLIFRKGRLRSREGSAVLETSAVHVKKGGHRRDPCETPDNVKETSKWLGAQDSAKQVAADPPMLDMSFDHDSSFAPNLNMALVDKRLNTILRADPQTERRSSAVKNAIQRELRNSGAEISRCASEPPTSSQVEEPSNPEPGSTKEAEPAESIQEKWAGTQFLLNQAQRDLVTSPEKQNPNGGSQDKAKPQSSGDGSREEFGGREPLKQLSQEPMPSTQQLLGDFEGWSTVKKPRAAYRSSPLPTPTATGRSGWTPINATEASFSTSGLDLPRDDTTRRRGSLRFSMCSVSSLQDTALKQKPTPIQSSSSKLSTNNVITPVAILKSSNQRRPSTLRSLDIPGELPSAEPMEENLTSQSFTSGPPLSSFQAGQAESGLLRDPSNLSETIEDLTRDILCTEDLECVISQVR